MRFLHASSSLVAVSVVVGVLIASCTGGGNTADGSCMFEGQRRANGESFTAFSAGDCNTCRCVNGSATCTARGCGDASPPGGCQYNGSQRSAGESFTSTDGCNTCSCGADGSVACTEKACISDAGKDSGDAGYACPPDGTIDCMPAVPPQNAAFCAQPYRGWIEANCPDVMFVD